MNWIKIKWIIYKLDRLIPKIHDLSHTKITESEYDKNYRKNWWLDANEIIEKGVADHIITNIEELF